jgi:hypothetical protein
MFPHAINFRINGGKSTEIYRHNVEKIEYNICVLSGHTLAHGLEQPMHEEQWKELAADIKCLITKKNSDDIDERSVDSHPFKVGPRC